MVVFVPVAADSRKFNQFDPIVTETWIFYYRQRSCKYSGGAAVVVVHPSPLSFLAVKSIEEQRFSLDKEKRPRQKSETI